MTDEIKLTADAALGSRAAQLMEDELLSGAFAELERAYIAKWRSTDALDASAREALYLAVNVIGKVKEHLAVVLANGKLAAKELDLMSKRRR